MTVKSKSTLKLQNDATIYENSEGLILADEVNTLVADIIDSAVVTEDGTLNNYYTTGQTDILLSGITSTYDSTLDPDLAVPTSVGGIVAGTKVSDLTGSTFTAMFDDLLFPTVQPTLTAPSGTFVMSPTTTLYESGATITTLTFTSTFNRGTIYNGSTYQNTRSGLPNTYFYTGTTLTNQSSTTLTDVQTITNYSVLLGYQSWSGAIAYDSGATPLDNKSNPATTPALVAGTLNSASQRIIEGVVALYGTTSSIVTPSKQTLVSMITGNNIIFNMVAEGSSEKQRFYLPDLWTETRPLQNVQTYNTVSNTWETTGLGQWTTGTEAGFTGYTRYKYNGSDRGNVAIKLIF